MKRAQHRLENRTLKIFRVRVLDQVIYLFSIFADHFTPLGGHSGPDLVRGPPFEYSGIGL